jgi:hypothetical protein
MAVASGLSPNSEIPAGNAAGVSVGSSGEKDQPFWRGDHHGDAIKVRRIVDPAATRAAGPKESVGIPPIGQE